MQAIEVALIVALALVFVAALVGNVWFQRGGGPLPWIAERFGIKLPPKERSDVWSRWFRR